MKMRRMKMLALGVVSGGVLLQAGGCGTILADIALQNIISLLISGVINGLRMTGA
ncbi:MAG: hypothetical protein KDA32_01955 [Phycisphaerales bacterium]|nr:hypothetical protein [Phycisphaerales bacterium]